MEINQTSGYWLGSGITDRYYDPLTGEYNKPSGKDLFALSGYRRAISNFVRIVTSKDIPVQFRGNDSYTDGKSVVLSGNIKDGNFDVAVGLALHEGSHIKLTDFSSLKYDICGGGALEYGPSAELREMGEKKNFTKYQLRALVKNLLNVVEDRRIDKFIQTEAPGYKGYYKAMYDYYFNDKIIDKALKTQQWCNKTIEDYEHHIINFINPNRTLDLLPGLREIWNILDLRNISRLKSTDDALLVAVNMAKVIIKNVDPVENLDDLFDDLQQEAGEDSDQSLEEKVMEKMEKLQEAKSKLEGDTTTDFFVKQRQLDKVDHLLEKFNNLLEKIFPF